MTSVTFEILCILYKLYILTAAASHQRAMTRHTHHHHMLLYPLPGYYGIPPLTAHPLSVQPHASDRSSLAEWGTPYPLPHHTSLYQTYPNTTYHAISVPTTTRHSQQVEVLGTGRTNQLLISHREPQLTHTQTHRPSGSSSLESGCTPAKIPHVGTILDPNNQLHTQGSSSGSGSTGKSTHLREKVGNYHTLNILRIISLTRTHLRQ